MSTVHYATFIDNCLYLQYTHIITTFSTKMHHLPETDCSDSRQ